ncbi:MAG TPA: tyrosine-type recombinase/integrase [Anaerolineales bacterium]
MGHQEVPVLLSVLFGDKAPLVREEASERMLRWCQAFEDWLAERAKVYPENRRKLQFVWKQLLSQTGKPPWEILPEDISAYAEGLKAQGRAPRTICNHLVVVSSFYRWCNKHHGEANSDMGHNPVKDVPRPKIKLFGGATVLSRAEACALLAVLKLDDCILTKRDYAFFLARLRLGLPLKALQQLQWGELEDRGPGTDDRGPGTGDGPEWGGGSKTIPLPEDVQRAIVDYLRAAGRLEGMRPEAYIFAPVVDPLREEAPDRAEDWDEGRYVVARQFNAVLRTYGGLAGIPEEKLTLRALRHTAVMLRMEAGDSVAAIHAFLGHSALSYTKYYLKLLPFPPREGEQLRDLAKDPPRLPERKATPFKPGDNMTHGLYAQKQPPEEIAAILAEDIQGMGEEMAALRGLCRSLVMAQIRAEDAREVALLADAYTLGATRLAEMVKAERQSQEHRPEETWAEQMLAMLVNTARAEGADLDIDTAREMALASDPQLGAAAWRLVEEIAATRLALRRVFHLAMETEQVAQLVHLTDVYGRGCIRLVRLLKGEGVEHSRLDAVMNDLLDRVTEDVGRELGIE